MGGGGTSLTDIGATASASPLGALRRIIIVSLAIGAVLIGLLALHAIVVSHSGVPAVTTGAVQHAHAAEESGAHAGIAGALSSQQEGMPLSLLECDQNCALGCALIAMTCLLLVILVGMVFLARYPALFHRLVDRGRRTIQRIPEARNHVYFPSLTVLSISRT